MRRLHLRNHDQLSFLSLGRFLRGLRGLGAFSLGGWRFFSLGARGSSRGDGLRNSVRCATGGAGCLRNRGQYAPLTRTRLHIESQRGAVATPIRNAQQYVSAPAAPGRANVDFPSAHREGTCISRCFVSARKRDACISRRFVSTYSVSYTSTGTRSHASSCDRRSARRRARSRPRQTTPSISSSSS